MILKRKVFNSFKLVIEEVKLKITKLECKND